jgi:hypothetical protein
MPNVVVVGGTIKCNHGGSVQLLQGDQRLEIAGSAVIVSGMETGLSFGPGSPGLLTPCPWPIPVTPPAVPVAGSSPCAATMAAVTGFSLQLTVGGNGALLDNASGPASNPNDPTATWSVAMAGQTLVSVDH